MQEKLVLLAAWCILTAGVSHTNSPSDFKAAIHTAAQAAAAEFDEKKSAYAADADQSVYSGFAAIHGFVGWLENAARAACASNVAYASNAGSRVAKLADASAIARRDSEFGAGDMMRQPLWHEGRPPSELRPESFGPTLFDTDPRFAFFARWYDGMLRGEPLPWDLQEKVARIPEETWKAGADAVAAAIEEIEAAFLAEKAPLAEQVSYNPDTGRFFAEPIQMQNAAFMAGLMARTADALDDALHGNNGLREDMREVRVLRRTHERYANDPQRVEMDYVSVAVSLRRNFESKELADSEDNLALLDAVEEGARGIRAHHREVAANRESLARQALRELPAEAIALLEDAAETLPEISEGVMKEDFERDIPKLINDALTPLPNGAPPLPGMDEANRIFSRVAKTRLKIADATKAGARIVDSNEFKTVRLAKEVFTLLSALVVLGLQLLRIL